jgi:DNA-binding SARP family transcriptional activator/DNA-binding XRE family transcriptional regulator/Tfp pilus assembly protein PilF
MKPPGTVGGLLREHRLRAGMTQPELARRAGVSVRALRDLEQGRVRRPRSRSVQRLAAALGLADADRARLLAAAGQEATITGDGRLHVGVLGPLVVRRGDVPVAVGQAKLRALLGLLAVQPGQVVPREELVDVLWGERPPATCLALVHTYVAQLRGLLEPGRQGRAPAHVVVRVPGGYLLALDADQLDALRFDELEASARRAQTAGNPGGAVGLFAQALAAWRGPVLADLDPRLRQHPAVVALSQRRLAAALAHADCAIAVGRGAEAAASLRMLGLEEPLHEGLHARLMLALASGGQQAAALQLFTELRVRLAEELGVEPGAEVQDAHLRILRQQLPTPADIATTTTVHAAGWTTPAQLPADVADFTGRRQHLEQLDRLLTPDGHATAVVISAIAGTAGVGKTALAVHWAHRVRDRFPDGQLYVNLHGYASGPPVPPVRALAQLLHALGVAGEQVPVDLEEAAGLFRTLLADKRTLLVLDNARSAEQVRPLLPGSPGCLVVVTSRDRLGGLVAREGARRLTLDVLDPAEANSLLARIVGERRVRAERQAMTELAMVCALLPLALRIAAANLTFQPQRRIADYVAELSAGNRLLALEVEGDEHTAVRAAFDLSYTTLEDEAQRLFRLLGLVPGPDVTVEAAAAIAGTTARQAGWLLDRLAGAHLLDHHSPGRFAFHDLLRLYAAERARQQDSEEARTAATRRLYDHYLHTTDAAARMLYPELLRLPPSPAGDQPPQTAFDDHSHALAWLDAERPNLVAAAEHAAGHGPRPAAWLLADALRGYFGLRMHTVDWLAVAYAGLAAAEAEGELRAQAPALLSLAAVHMRQGQFQRSIEHYTRALTCTRQTGWLEGEAATLGNLGLVYWQLGRLHEAADLYTQAVALNQRAGWLAGQAAALTNLGLVYRELGRLEQAAEHYRQVLALTRRTESLTEAVDLGNLGETYHALGRLDDALDHLTRALVLHRETGNRGAEAETLRSLAEVHRDAGRHPQALENAQAALALARDPGERRYEADALNTLATIHCRLGRHQEAIKHYQRALGLAREIEARYPEVGALIGLAAAHHHLGHPDQAHAAAHQARMLARQAGYQLLEGQALTTVAGIQLDRNDVDQAIHDANEALAVHRETGHRLGEAHTQLILGHALRRSGETRAADAHWQEALALFTEVGTPEADHVVGLLRPHGTTPGSP